MHKTLDIINYIRGKKNETQLADITNEWSDWTPTLTWTTAIPVNVSAVAKYKIIGKTLFFLLKVLADDGNNATNLEVDMPVTLKDNGLDFLLQVPVKVGSSTSTRTMIIQDGESVVKYNFMGTATIGSALQLYMNGVAEIE